MRPILFWALVLTGSAPCHCQERGKPPAGLADALTRPPAPEQPPASSKSAQTLVARLASTPLPETAGLLHQILAAGAAAVAPLQDLLREPPPPGSAIARCRRPSVDKTEQLAGDGDRASSRNLGIFAREELL